jgi:AcrR family transcriptional regulator
MGSESAVRPRRRAQHLGPERRRPQVLDTALQIAVGEGVAAVTIAAVAERMHVTRPVVYACFADRVELIEALIRREEEYLLRGIAGALPHRRVEADEQVVIDGFRALLDTVSARPDTWKLLYGNPDPAVAGSFGHGRRLAVDRCLRRLRPTLRAWGTEDAERKLPALVELWVSAGEGAVRTLLSGENDWTSEELGTLVGKAVFRALRLA